MLRWGFLFAFFIGCHLPQDAIAQGECYRSASVAPVFRPRQAFSALPLPPQYNGSLNVPRRQLAPTDPFLNPTGTALNRQFYAPQVALALPGLGGQSAFDVARRPSGGPWGLGITSNQTSGLQHTSAPLAAGFVDPKLFAPPVGMMEQLETEHPGRQERGASSE